MFLNKKAQTSMEFLIVFLFLILFTFLVTYSINSTFDVTYAIYKTKTKAIYELSKTNNFLIINNINYSINNKDLNIFVNFITHPCPNFDYDSLETNLISRTKFDTINIENRCT
jgi:uncharacterized protein (UPF0333 family)